MSRPTVHVEIDEMVLDGFDEERLPSAGDALEEALARRLPGQSPRSLPASIAQAVLDALAPGSPGRERPAP